MFDLDRYYTPRDLAVELLTDCMHLKPNICVDSTCGEGNLLDAADTVFGNVKCIGIDKDKKAIKSLRKRKPNWMLSVADMLNPQSVKRTHVATNYLNSDLLILNPPFSLGRKKTYPVEFNGNKLKSSIAMAHVLTSLDLFKPKHGAFLIVPESLLYSEADALARELLFRKYSYSEMGELHCSTFSGARARSVAIKLILGENNARSHVYITSNEKTLNTKIVRGGLPIHRKVIYPRGLPYIHTTDLANLFGDVGFNELTKVQKCTRGHVDGWVILLPRVGVPNLTTINPVFIKKTVQLSDCVIALLCRNKTNANNIAKRIKSNWKFFESHYKGTGARYTTITRLKDCLSTICISSNV